ncbi:proteasome assembly chaperone family protein [Candidatus Woesearchaeota archaeon]|nr:proteasome assembly chaperone family protein [Candidatus Woesearchaeota archaeon]
MSTIRIDLKKKPQTPIIIQGFPGFGLIGTIATEFLIEHLKAEPIGEFMYDELPPTIAIHQGKLIKPMEVYHAKKENIIILHTILASKGVEWKIADLILDMRKKLKAKKLICLEGVMSPEGEGIFYYGDKQLENIAKPIKESIIMGVTAGIMTRTKDVTALFAESHSQLPDSKAAAKLIEVLDKHLGLDVDPKPLLQQAQEFEQKLKGILQQANKAGMEKERKDLSYLG